MLNLFSQNKYHQSTSDLKLQSTSRICYIKTLNIFLLYLRALERAKYHTKGKKYSYSHRRIGCLASEWKVTVKYMPDFCQVAGITFLSLTVGQTLPEQVFFYHSIATCFLSQAQPTHIPYVYLIDFLFFSYLLQCSTKDHKLGGNETVCIIVQQSTCTVIQTYMSCHLDLDNIKENKSILVAIFMHIRILIYLYCFAL